MYLVKVNDVTVKYSGASGCVLQFCSFLVSQFCSFLVAEKVVDVALTCLYGCIVFVLLNVKIE